MSEKEWEINYNEVTDTYTVKEKKPYEYSPSTDDTGREKLNKKLRNMGKGGKIFLTVLFNLYGSLFRFSSNTSIGFIYGFLDLLLGKYLFYSLLVEATKIVSEGKYEDLYGYAILLAIQTLLWLIDLLSIISRNDILFLGNKEYKNYNEYKRK